MKDKVTPDIGTLRAARKVMGITQSEICKKLELRQGTYSKYESGRYPMNRDLFLKIIEIMEMPSSFFFNRSDSEINLINRFNSVHIPASSIEDLRKFFGIFGGYFYGNRGGKK